MRIYITIIFVLVSLYGCHGQTLQSCKDTIEVDIENSSFYDKESLIKDSMKAMLQIIFEQKFDDTIHVICGNKLVHSKRILTNKAMGVSPDFVEVDYSKFNTIPKISILIGSKDCISFYPRRGKRVAYVNYINQAWSIILSNGYREYR